MNSNQVRRWQIGLKSWMQVYVPRVHFGSFRWFQIRSQHISRLCCHSEGPLWAGEIRQLESCKFQQKEKQSPAQAVCLDNSFAEQDLDVLVNKLNMLPQCALAWKSILGYVRKRIASRPVRVAKTVHIDFHLGKRQVKNAWNASERITDDGILRFLYHLSPLEFCSLYLGNT